MEGCGSMGVAFQFYVTESSGDLLHNSVDVLNTIEVHT